MSYRFFAIGCGEGGGRIADKFYEKGYVTDAVAINTSETDLKGLKHIPENGRQLWLRPSGMAKGGGTGKNPRLGAEVARKYSKEIGKFISSCIKEKKCDFILLTIAGGGGTGSGLAIPLVEITGELGKPVGVIYTLPSRSDGTVAQINALEILKPLYNTAIQGGVSPFILVDNQKLLTTSRGNVIAYWDEVNARIGRPLHAFNLYSDKTSQFISAMDTADFGTLLLSGGSTSIGGFVVKEEDFDNIDKAIGQLHQGHLMEGFDPRTAKAAGIIVVGKPELLSKEPVVRLYDSLMEEVVNQLEGGLIFKGVYADENINFIRVNTMFNGMTLPSKKIDVMLQEVRKGYAAMQKKENRVSGLNFAFENTEALRSPGMERLVKFQDDEEEKKK